MSKVDIALVCPYCGHKGYKYLAPGCYITDLNPRLKCPLCHDSYSLFPLPKSTEDGKLSRTLGVQIDLEVI